MSGLTAKTIRRISEAANDRHLGKEPEWMLDFRLEAGEKFKKMGLPEWGPSLQQINFNEIEYYRSGGSRAKTWDDVPDEVRNTYEELGIPAAEREVLSGVAAQVDSNVIYESVRAELERQGVVFVSTEEGVRKHEKIFKKYFGKLIPPENNKFAALNSAAWSGGSFIYVPPGVEVEMPIQTYFLIKSQDMGQFERTLIVADSGSFVHYVEGCSAPTFASSSLHAGVVEVFVEEGARVRYTTIQNWSKNVYNLTTKKARVEKNGIMEWVDGNIGSKITMKYPACVLAGEGARGELLSMALAGKGQVQDSGGKMIHLADNTSSRIISKSVSKDGGTSTYRGDVFVSPNAKGVKVFSNCDSLIMDGKSRAESIPRIKVESRNAEIQHEATAQRISDEKLFYLQSRGISRQEAESLFVSGFIDPIVREIPLEYAVEMNRLVELEMTDAIG